jgi:hypothetical protein
MDAAQNWLGAWSGTKQVWLYPGAEAMVSASTAQVSTAAQGQFLVLSYAWEAEGEPQDGMILFPPETGEGAAKGVWLDSWHVKDELMVCAATGEGGTVTLSGSYPAPEGPDWGWRIEIGGPDGSLVVRMTNITPQGEEALAVLAEYGRAGQAG